MTAPDARRGRLAPHRRAVRAAKRTAVGVAGATVIAVGAAMLVLPGPGLLVIVAGLALLGTEFAWAERRLHHARGAFERALRRPSPPKEQP